MWSVDDTAACRPGKFGTLGGSACDKGGESSIDAPIVCSEFSVLEGRKMSSFRQISAQTTHFRGSPPFSDPVLNHRSRLVGLLLPLYRDYERALPFPSAKGQIELRRLPPSPNPSFTFDMSNVNQSMARLT